MQEAYVVLRVMPGQLQGRTYSLMVALFPCAKMHNELRRRRLTWPAQSLQSSRGSEGAAHTRWEERGCMGGDRTGREALLESAGQRGYAMMNCLQALPRGRW